MSGIVGMFCRDGAPADVPLLHALTRFLSFRGPDAREVWSHGPVALGHTLLRTTGESAAERQPFSLDGELCITADARLDCRSELEAALAHAGCEFRRAAPDAELILHAYAAWGKKCVERLRGDFAFAIWDARRKSLFCARDHFGIKPFYYAALGPLLLFSNTLDCLRAHPAVSGELHEPAIADFLLFGVNCDPATTTFCDIRRLPPAHTLCVSAEVVGTERYWSPPMDGRIRYRRADEYVEHFQEVFQKSVGDRLRIPRAGILLSGGLDSSSVAATVKQLSAQSAAPVELRAFTVTYESLFPERDGEHARAVAEFLRIPIQLVPLGQLRLFERWDDPELRWPEPVDDPLFAGLFDQFRAIAADCRVVLNGEGADNLMYFEMWPYARDLCRRREWRRLFFETLQFLGVRRFPWRGLRRRAQEWLAPDAYARRLPLWFAPEFAARTNPEGRWRKGGLPRVEPAHPLRPTAHASLSLPQWTQLFELSDPGVTRCPVEQRFPFLDLRIVDYLLALPPFPWSFEKTLLRQAMSGYLPENIRSRPKTPLPRDPVIEMLHQPESEWLNSVPWGDDIRNYIQPQALPSLLRAKDPERIRTAMRLVCLNFWLQSARRLRYNLSAEVRND